MRYIVDRFEGDAAVCEDEQGSMILISKGKLPIETVEGSCLMEENHSYFLDDEATKKRREYMESLLEQRMKSRK